MEPPAGSSKEYYKTRSNKSLIDEINVLKDKYKESIIVNANFIPVSNHMLSCPAGNKFVYINNFGCVSPCPWVHEKNPEMLSTLSLRNNTLDEVLKDKKIKEFLKIKESGKCYGEI